MCLAAVGVACLIGGVSLVLTYWAYVVVLFKGVIGGVLAVAGLIVLLMIQRNR
jgi:hypothetical protein